MLFCSPSLISKIRSNPTCPEGNFLGYPVSFEAVKNLIKNLPYIEFQNSFYNLKLYTTGYNTTN